MATLGPLVVVNQDGSYSWFFLELERNRIFYIQSAALDTSENSRYPTEFVNGDLNSNYTLRVVQDLTAKADYHTYFLFINKQSLSRICVNATDTKYEFYNPERLAINDHGEIQWVSNADKSTPLNLEGYGITSVNDCDPLFHSDLNNVRSNCVLQWSAEQNRINTEIRQRNAKVMEEYALRVTMSNITSVEDLITPANTLAIQGNYDLAIALLSPKVRADLVDKWAKAFNPAILPSEERKQLRTMLTYDTELVNNVNYASAFEVRYNTIKQSIGFDENELDYNKNVLLRYVQADDTIRSKMQELCYIERETYLYDKLQATSLGLAIMKQLARLERNALSYSPYYSGCEEKFNKAVHALHEILDSIEINFSDETQENIKYIDNTITTALAHALFDPRNHALYDVFKEHRLSTAFNQAGVPSRSALNISFQYVQNQLTSLKTTGQNEAMIDALLQQLNTLQEASETYWPWNYGSQAKLYVIMESIVRMKYPAETTAPAFNKTNLVAAVNDENSDLYKALNKRGLFTFTEKAVELVAVEAALAVESTL